MFAAVKSKSRDFLGTLYNPFKEAFDLTMVNFNGSLKKINNYTYRIYCTRPQFEWVVKKYSIENNNFFLFLVATHFIGSGDKICSWNGQKGMIYIADNFYSHPDVDLIDCAISPSCILKRQTMGHVLDVERRGGKMYSGVKLGNDVIAGDFLIGKSACMFVNNLGPNHLYAAEENCNTDAVTNMAVKGCTRKGGYKICQQDQYSSLIPSLLYNSLNEMHDRADKIMIDDRIVINKTSVVSMDIIKHYNKKLKLHHEDNVQF